MEQDHSRKLVEDINGFLESHEKHVAGRRIAIVVWLIFLFILSIVVWKAAAAASSKAVAGIIVGVLWFVYLRMFVASLHEPHAVSYMKGAAGLLEGGHDYPDP